MHLVTREPEKTVELCIAPLTLSDGNQVACHECWQCRERAINDWVGRNIAESKTARASHAVTLTYGRSRAGDVDHERASILTYSDVQKYFKLLRRHGFPVRYFVTGEFGSKKGRAHWHIMLYWQDRVPPHELDRNFMEEHWPHGWSFWTKPTAHAVRYNCKYIQKDMGDALRQGHLAMSKKPPLGSAYFADLAERYVRQGLAPQTLEYRFSDVQQHNRTTGESKVVNFMLTDRSAELFLEHYIRTWRATYPGRHIPNSDLVEAFIEFGSLTGFSDDPRRQRPEVVPFDEKSWARRKKKARRETGWWRHDDGDVQQQMERWFAKNGEKQQDKDGL